MNQLGAETYQIEQEIFRRNYPLSLLTDFKYNVHANNLPCPSGDPFGPDDIDTEMDNSSETSVRSSQCSTISVDISQESSTLGSESSSEELDEDVEAALKGNLPNQKTYATTFNVISACLEKFVGKNKFNQKKIEKKTCCKLIIQKKRKSKEAEIKIISNISEEKVHKCVDLVKKELDKARWRTSPTHFVSIPISDEGFKEKYQRFIETIRSSEDVLDECKCPELFIKPEKLHLTLSVLRLFTDKEIQRAKECIDEQIKINLKEEIADGSILLEFPSLEHFENCKPEKTNVVYVKAVSQRLQQMANKMTDALANIGLGETRNSGEDVVLHMTILNTKYDRSKSKKHYVDARAIFENFRALDFDPIRINELRLCSMRSIDPETRNYVYIHSNKFKA